jgi:hypothetical protein
VIIDGVWIGELDLLTTSTHDSELQVMVSTLYKLPQHKLNLFPACCVVNSRSLATATHSGDTSASRAEVHF